MGRQVGVSPRKRPPPRSDAIGSGSASSGRTGKCGGARPSSGVLGPKGRGNSDGVVSIHGSADSAVGREAQGSAGNVGNGISSRNRTSGATTTSGHAAAASFAPIASSSHDVPCGSNWVRHGARRSIAREAAAGKGPRGGAPT